MKCPLQVIVGLTRGDSLNPAPVDCLQEECAWWSPINEVCFVQRLPLHLACLVQELQKVAKELTLIRPK
jgi:hypothetical protein